MGQSELMNKANEEALRRSAFFGEMSEALIGELVALATVRSATPGEVLFHQGHPAKGFVVLLAGKLMVYRVGEEGRRQVLHMFEEAGEVCGEVPVFEGGAYPATAEAMEASRYLYIARDDFLQVAREHPEFLLEMLAELSRRLRKFARLIDDLSLKDVPTRLAAYLLGCRTNPLLRTVKLAVSKATLAEQLGTIPETISRVLRRMQKEGIIAVSGRQIEIRDESRLRELAGE